MKITDHISKNLAAWMSTSQNLDTIKKVAAKSHVGFGTIRRVRNGDGNPTITNLCDIAKAFGRPLEDLITPANSIENIVEIKSSELIAPNNSPAICELIDLANMMDESSQWQLIGMAKLLAKAPPQQKNYVR